MNAIDMSGRKLRWLRWAGWSGAVALILLPLILMQVAPQSGVDWTFSDFVFAAVLLGTVGLLLELGIRTAASQPARLGVALAVGTGFLLIWSNLAVGYIGDGDSAINGMFLAIPLLALIASVAAGGRPAAMTWILGITALTHGITGAIGFSQDTRTGPITLIFVALWATSAIAFYRASRSSGT